MPNSFNDAREFYCQACESSFQEEVWLIIDVREREDLLEQIQEGWIPVGECPDCGAYDFSSPLLLYFPGDVPPTMLATGEMDQVYTTDKLDVIKLLERLQETSGDPAIKDHFSEPGNWVSKRDLPSELKDYPEVTLKDKREEFHQGLREIQEEHPRAFLFAAVEAYLKAPSLEKKARIVEAAPELLTGGIDEFFEKLVDHAEKAEDEWRLRIYRAQWDFLKRARAIGFAEAVEEYMVEQEE